MLPSSPQTNESSYFLLESYSSGTYLLLESLAQSTDIVDPIPSAPYLQQQFLSGSLPPFPNPSAKFQCSARFAVATMASSSQPSTHSEPSNQVSVPLQLHQRTTICLHQSHPFHSTTDCASIPRPIQLLSSPSSYLSLSNSGPLPMMFLPESSSKDPGLPFPPPSNSLPFHQSLSKYQSSHSPPPPPGQHLASPHRACTPPYPHHQQQRNLPPLLHPTPPHLVHSHLNRHCQNPQTLRQKSSQKILSSSLPLQRPISPSSRSFPFPSSSTILSQSVPIATPD